MKIKEKVKWLDDIYVSKGKMDYNDAMNSFEEEITDLKQAIKLYEDAGI